jgi:hypothetical protein
MILKSPHLCKHRRIVLILTILLCILSILQFLHLNKTDGCCKKEQCRIIAAGFQRSGSTWQYNVARLMLEEIGNPVYHTHGHPVDQISNAKMLQTFLNGSWTIAKSHHLWPEGAKVADCVLLTHRDARDTVLSWMRMFNSTDGAFLQRNIEQIARYTTEYMAWRKWCKNHSGCIEMAYQTLQSDHIEAIHSIQRHLGPRFFHLNATRIQEQVQELYNTNKLDWDPVTAFHTKHVTNGGSQVWKHGDWDEVSLKGMDVIFSSYHSALGYPVNHDE